MTKRWTIQSYDPLLQKRISDELNIHPIIAQLLINRGITTPQEANLFLSAQIPTLYNPFLLTDMDRAVERIEQACRRKEKILIYGDYDVDGVTSSALLRRICKRLGVEAVNYIPHRMEEGYGLNEGIVHVARDMGVALVITVDCGINAFEPVKALRDAGIDVIIIDHHEPDGERLPQANAVIDPKRQDCLYPFKHLSAVGLVAKLSQALFGIPPQEDLDLVALGTVADVVMLRGENRIFVKHGLLQIETTQKVGLKALLEISKVAGKKMKPYYIGFILGPRLNAAGRMDSATSALDLLLAEESALAMSLAQDLEGFNQSRQKMQNEVIQEAMGIIEEMMAHSEQDVLVVHKEGWHKGVLGIVASRIVDKYYKPTVVISIENGLATGSGRSIEGFHLHEAFANCAHLLTNYGGHKRAAGLRLNGDAIDGFRQQINTYAKSVLTKQDLTPLLTIDCEVPLNVLDLNFVKIIESMEPHGEGNPTPVFCARGVTVKSYPQVLGKDTLKFWVTDGSHSVSVVGFGMGSFKDSVKAGQKIDIAFQVGIDDWNKAPVVQLILKDVRT